MHFATVFYRRYKQCANVNESFIAAKESMIRMYKDASANVPTLINGDMASTAQVQNIWDALTALDQKMDGLTKMVHDIKAKRETVLLVGVGILILVNLAQPFISGLIR